MIASNVRWILDWSLFIESDVETIINTGLDKCTKFEYCPLDATLKSPLEVIW